MKRLKQLPVVGLLSLLAACGGGSGDSAISQTLQSADCASQACAEDKQFDVLASGQDGSYTDNRSFIVIKSQEALEQLWYDNGQYDAAPSIDFTKQMVIAVFNGRAQSSGYGIDVTAVEDQPQQLLVEVVLSEPVQDESCQYASVVTRPFQLVRLELSDKAVQFRSYEEEVDHCAQ